MMLDDIASYLATQGVGTVETDIFIAALPDSPDDCIALFEYAGSTPIHSFGTTMNRLDQPGLQVRVRNKSYETGRAKLQEIQNLLDGLSNETIEGHHYVGVMSSGGPMPLGRNANQNWEWTQSYRVTLIP